MRSELVGKRVGLMTVDPGRTSGYTISTPILFRGATTEEVFQNDKIEVGQVDCQNPEYPDQEVEMDGAIELSDRWVMARHRWAAEKVPYDRQFFVFEDFVLNRKPGSYDRSGLSAVRVTSLVQGILLSEVHQPNYEYQSPADAKSVATNERLKRWGLWTPRLEHGRDATRHAALWVRRALS